MQQRPKNTFFDGTQNTATMPPIREKGAHRKVNTPTRHVTSILPAYTGEGANWFFHGYYATCTCGQWQSSTYYFRGLPGLLATRHIHDNQ